MLLLALIDKVTDGSKVFLRLLHISEVLELGRKNRSDLIGNGQLVTLFQEGS